MIDTARRAIDFHTIAHATTIADKIAMRQTMQKTRHHRRYPPHPPRMARKSFKPPDGPLADPPVGPENFDGENPGGVHRCKNKEFFSNATACSLSKWTASGMGVAAGCCTAGDIPCGTQCLSTAAAALLGIYRVGPGVYLLRLLAAALLGIYRVGP